MKLPGKILVKNFLMHLNAHLDEIAGRMFLRIEGGKMFSGLLHAGTVFRGDPNAVNAEEELRKGNLCVGIGGGPFDEHNTGKQTCCARLVTEELGIYGKDEAATTIVNEVCRADRTNQVSPYELPSLVKGWHRLAPPKDVMMWGETSLSDVYRFMRGDIRYGSITFTMQDLAAEACEKYAEFLSTTPSLVSLIEDLKKMSFENAPILSLANIIHAQQMLYPEQLHETVVRARAMMFIGHLAELRKQFQRCFDSYKEYHVVLPLQQDGKNLFCSIQKTDNPDVARVARIKGAAVVIVQNSQGHIRVISNTIKYHNLDLSRVVSEIRMRELAKRGCSVPTNIADVWHWEKAETLPEVPWWYYLKNGQLILNGSDQSSQDVPPTVLTINEVLEAIWVNVRFNDAAGNNTAA